MDDLKQRYKELGDFLKARRAKIVPSQVGLSEGLRRRIPGLRREEVSFLSGVGLTLINRELKIFKSISIMI
ncbi:hypothetical protein [uncultured Clostridium sp.]|uniref:hypothetical protein n=1 Tax=uncultured Clostridium sp. TaxID=59620 RepID=UPI0028F14100|nr:hypothetical protein [uncultured Clostridium sp.]